MEKLYNLKRGIIMFTFAVIFVFCTLMFFVFDEEIVDILNRAISIIVREMKEAKEVYDEVYQ